MDVITLPKHGRYFQLRSLMNDYVMTVDNALPRPQVTLHPRQKSKPNQLWYEDNETKTIRSKLNGYCLDMSGKTLQIAPYSGQISQQLIIDGRHVVRIDNPNEALDVLEANKNPGAVIGKYGRHNDSNQLWAVDYACPQYIVIQNMTNSCVLTAEGGTPGTRVYTSRQSSVPEDNQLWYEDKFGIVRSKMNDLALDSSSGSICLQPYNASSLKQQYMISSNSLVNRHDRCLVLHLNMQDQGNKAVVSGKAGNTDSERWRIQDAKS